MLSSLLMNCVSSEVTFTTVPVVTVNRIGPKLLIRSVWVYLETKGSHYMVICCI